MTALSFSQSMEIRHAVGHAALVGVLWAAAAGSSRNAPLATGDGGMPELVVRALGWWRDVASDGHVFRRYSCGTAAGRFSIRPCRNSPPTPKVSARSCIGHRRQFLAGSKTTDLITANKHSARECAPKAPVKPRPRKA